MQKVHLTKYMDEENLTVNIIRCSGGKSKIVKTFTSGVGGCWTLFEFNGKIHCDESLKKDANDWNTKDGRNPDPHKTMVSGEVCLDCSYIK